MLRRQAFSAASKLAGPHCHHNESWPCQATLAQPHRSRSYSGTAGVSPKSKVETEFDRDFFVSVLEASATKRDAKGYLQKYTSAENSLKLRLKIQPDQKKLQTKVASPTAVAPLERQINALSTEIKQYAPTEPQLSASATEMPPLHLALMQIRFPQLMDEATKEGVAKSLSQLRTLGLLCIVVIDCGPSATNKISREQCERLGYAINNYRGPGAKVVENTLAIDENLKASNIPFSADGIFVAYPRELEQTLAKNVIPILPALASEPCTLRNVASAPDSILVSLVKYFTNLQTSATSDFLGRGPVENPMASSIEKIIILDQNGGLPFSRGSRFSHRFVNLNQEYDMILKDLEDALQSGSGAINTDGYNENVSHIRSLKVVRDTLALLPTTSSALITTPMAAANVCPASSITQQYTADPPKSKLFGIAASVRTRKSLNPLIHNLLTDKPIYSSSLPFEKISGPSVVSPPDPKARMGTLVKRGSSVTIYPRPSVTGWVPPQPGAPRLRLTDNCIDLPKLSHLIKDSFGRELDVAKYLKRMENDLAGIIIAGNYEGAAILTWERPSGLTEEMAYKENRFVPYLDKFAVLRSSQGTSGVADILFNSMVRDCFPQGVCWRSRMNNPVNKWYFERSQGTMKLPDTHWTMFWTTPKLFPGEMVLKDYEDVCRKIQPTWLD
ncbi:Amino-acid acetyltransferase, mitochondrial [Ceratocystis lukuohia]|uniref:Amino-acid acetyltransferase, mitochondrial n=1 Tax=Ceratocystis lukuohia TaxID=2019550 RepID=A0ABR4MLS9_9PEZI